MTRPILAIFLAIMIIFTILAMPAVSAERYAGSTSWYMSGGDARQTSQSANSFWNIPNHREWELDVIASSEMVVADDGTIYVGLANSSLAAIGADGAAKWYLPLTAPIIDSPSIGKDGAIYYFTSEYWGNWASVGGSCLYSVYPNGTIAHVLFIPRLDSRSTPVISDDGRVFLNIGTLDQYTDSSRVMNEIWCLDPDLNIIWTYSENYTTEKFWNSGRRSEPTIGPDGSVTVLFNGTVLHLWKDGEKVWAYDPGFEEEDFTTFQQQRQSVMIDDYNRIIFGFEDYGICLLPNGTVAWKHHFISPCVYPLALDDRQIIFSYETGIFSLHYDGQLSWGTGIGPYNVYEATLTLSKVLVFPSANVIMLQNANGGSNNKALECEGTADTIDPEWCVVDVVVTGNDTVCYEAFSENRAHGKIVCMNFVEGANLSSKANSANVNIPQLFILVIALAAIVFAIGFLIPKKKVPKQ